jgi:ribose transport system substrate-binding protein
MRAGEEMRREMIGKAWKPGALVAMLCLALALGLAACGGGSSSSETTASSGSGAESEGSASEETAANEEAGGEEAGVEEAGGEGVSKQGIVEFRKPKAGSGEGKKIGLIELGSAVPFSNLVTKSVEQAANEAGAELVTCDSELEGQPALDCAKSFATQGVEGYLNFQSDAELSEAICTAGPQVPVIAVDIAQEPCEVAFMGADNEYAGFIAGKAVGEFAKNEWNCEYDAYVSLEEPEAGSVNEERMGGYRKGFQEICPGDLKNEKKLNASRSEVARTQFTDALTALPNMERIIAVGINDESVLAALAAAKTAGREKDVFVSGQGTEPNAVCAIKHNPQWIADTAYFPERYGEIGVPYLLEAMEGKEIPKKLLVPHELLTSKNIEQVYEVTGC